MADSAQFASGTVRVLPYHDDLVTRFLPGYIKWAV